MQTTYSTVTYYPLNTRTKVPTDNPDANEFGHTGAGGCQFLYLVNAQTGGTPKVVADYGSTEDAVGQEHSCVQDTGLGHRSMPNHLVVAVKRADGTVEGTLPKGKTLPFWVMK